MLWLFVLAAGIGGTLYFARQIGPLHEDEDGGVDLMLPVAAGDLRAIEIVVRGELRRIERDSTGAWLYHRRHADAASPHGHVAAPGEAGAIGGRVDMLSRTRIERTIVRSGAEASRYGVQLPPVMAIFYTGAAMPVLRMQVGNPTPDGFSYYALIPERDAIVTVATHQVENLLRLFEEAGNAPA